MRMKLLSGTAMLSYVDDQLMPSSVVMITGKPGNSPKGLIVFPFVALTILNMIVL